MLTSWHKSWFLGLFTSNQSALQDAIRLFYFDLLEVLLKEVYFQVLNIIDFFEAGINHGFKHELFPFTSNWTTLQDEIRLVYFDLL